LTATTPPLRPLPNPAQWAPFVVVGEGAREVLVGADMEPYTKRRLLASEPRESNPGAQGRLPHGRSRSRQPEHSVSTGAEASGDRLGKALDVSQGCIPGLTGANTDRLIDWRHEDLAIPDLAHRRRAPDRLNHFVGVRSGNDNIYPDLG
jgi:hypothetical protein